MWLKCVSVVYPPVISLIPVVWPNSNWIVFVWMKSFLFSLGASHLIWSRRGAQKMKRTEENSTRAAVAVINYNFMATALSKHFEWRTTVPSQSKWNGRDKTQWNNILSASTIVLAAELNFDFNKTDSGKTRFIFIVDHHSSATGDCRFVVFSCT